MKKPTLIVVIFFLIVISCTKGNVRNDACSDTGLYYPGDSTSVQLPNLFTPNGDGKNDEFLISCGSSLISYSLKVTAGNKIYFEATNPQSKWDGTYKGKEVREGVYDYELSVGFSSSDFYKKGKITLIRDLEKLPRMTNCNKCKTFVPEFINFCE